MTEKRSSLIDRLIMFNPLLPTLFLLRLINDMCIHEKGWVFLSELLILSILNYTPHLLPHVLYFSDILEEQAP